MSASLVGSEMCIRDSTHSTRSSLIVEICLCMTGESRSFTPRAQSKGSHSLIIVPPPSIPNRSHLRLNP
eukprot:12522793-Alexandrium_andersonii.AAC.1